MCKRSKMVMEMGAVNQKRCAGGLKRQQVSATCKEERGWVTVG